MKQQSYVICFFIGIVFAAFQANCITVEYGNAFIPRLMIGEPVTLRWTSESIGVENTLMTIWYQNKESSWSFRESIFNINYPVIEEDAAANALFPDGVKANFGNKSIELTIKKLRYNYTGFYVFQIGKAPQPIHINKIFGGPEFCEEKPLKEYTFKETESPTISLILCGVPQPYMKWKFRTGFIYRSDYRSYTGLVKEVNLVRNTYYAYRYKIKLPKLRRPVCKGYLSIKANEFANYGHKMDVKIPVFSEFAPNAIEQIRFFKSENSCNTVQWRLLETGCNEDVNDRIQYHIEYFSNSGMIGRVTGINWSVQAWCSGLYDDATAVVMWASYNGLDGRKSSLVYLDGHEKESRGLSTATRKALAALSATFIVMIIGFVILIFWWRRVANKQQQQQRNNEQTEKSTTVKVDKYQNKVLNNSNQRKTNSTYLNDSSNPPPHLDLYFSKEPLNIPEKITRSK